MAGLVPAKTRWSVFLSLLSLATLAACSASGLLNATIPRNGLVIEHDIAYGPDPRQRLDIYRPEGSGKHPVIVFFYGGGWDSGRKSMYPFVAATLARQGNVVVVPDYRLYPQVRFPAFLQDCARAVAWTIGQTGRIGGDPGRVFLMGHSAGAYNAAMLALDPAWLAAAGTSRDRLAGAIGLAGPYDFLPMTGTTVRAVFAPAADGPSTQPVTFVDGRAPPMLLLAGEADETVRPRNTVSLAADIRARGGEVRTRLYPGIGHIGLVLAIAPLFQGRAPVLEDVQSFITAAKSAAGRPQISPASAH